MPGQYDIEAPTRSEVVGLDRVLSLPWKGWISQIVNLINAKAIWETSYNPPSLASGASVTVNMTTPGVRAGDFAQASFFTLTAGIVVTANVSAADTTSVTFRNETGGTVDLASGTLRVLTERVL